jgi:hypothetical protein
MKKLIIVLIFLAVISPIFAQEVIIDKSDSFYPKNNTDNKKEPFYYINIRIEKIYPTTRGYVVQYRNSAAEIITVGIHDEWFTNAASKAELVRLPTASDWPTMSVFYNNGVFSHVRLYIHPARSHQTWGNIPLGYDISKYFPDKDNLKLQF